MDSFDLHSLILEELSTVLAATCKPTDTAGTDPAVQKVLAQCPPLPDRHSEQAHRLVVTKRHENGILALAKLLSTCSSAIVRASLLGQVLDFASALPKYSYSSSAFGVNGVHSEHWFLKRLISRLLACAAQAPESAEQILTRIWALLGDLAGILESEEHEHIVTFALPALLGSMEALEKSAFRYRPSDVLQADALSQRLLAPVVIENIHNAITSPAATMPARRTIALYLQSGIGLSGNYLLAQFLLVIRAVLESRLAVRLVECGLLDAQLIDRKSPHQLWELISQLDIHRRRSADELAVQVDSDPQLAGAYSRFLAISLQTYADTRSVLVRNMRASDGADEITQEHESRPALKLGTKPSPSLATNMSIEYRTLYAGTLVSLLMGSLDPALLQNILDHVCSEFAHRMDSLTVVCFRVLVTIASFFPSSRDTILAAVSSFITSPPERLVRDLHASGGSSSQEDYLVLPAASALQACMHLATSKPRIVSTIHTLINTLAASRIGGDASARTLRISRSTILVLSHLALLYNDPEITALVVSMVCAPRFTTNAQLIPLVIQCSASVAAIADVSTFGNVVATALKRVSFARDSDDSTNVSVSQTLVDLAAHVGDRTEIIDGFFCDVLKSFVDISIDVASPSKFKNRAVTPLSTFLPILDALVSSPAYAIDKEATAEQISLWRNFWFHMVIRGYVTDRSYIKSYGRIFANLASKSPILVHPSSINYLETEIEYNSILQREFSDARLAQLRQALTPIVSQQNSALLRSIGFPQAVFLLAVYHVEVARARAGNCATVLHYFGNSAVTSSNLLPEVESIAELVILAYVRETTSRRWSVEVSLAGNQPRSDLAVDAEAKTADKNLQTRATSVVKAQVRELMVASCHHLEQVSKWAQHFAEKILRAFPQALLDRSVIFTLLELVQLVWKSCKAEQDDQFVPVYWFTSETLGITLQLPDSITYRKTLFTRVSACAKRWLEMVGRAAPLELETLLQIYLSTPCDDNLDYEPHIGHSLAIEVGNNIKFGVAVSVNAGALATNSSAFSYRLGLRNYLRGYIGHGRDVQALKQSLSDIYATAKESPGMPLPETGPSLREVIELLQSATQQVVADAEADRELARLLVWVPLALFDESVMRAATHMWTTLIVERADVEVLIMVELTIAWTWLIQQHLGLFSQRFEPKNPFAAKMSYTPSDKSARSRGYAVISRSLNPQTLLIEFLLQRFDSVKHLSSVNFNVVNAILRILQVSFANCDRITTNALARGPLFMFVHLGFKMLKLGFERSAILESKLRDGLYKMAFRWFAQPPRWSFSGSKATLAREIQILIDTRHTIKGDTPVLHSMSSQVSPGSKWTPTTSNPTIGLTARDSSSSLDNSAGGNGATSNLPHSSSASSHSRSHGILHLHKRHPSTKSPAIPPVSLSTAALSESTSVTSLSEDDADREMILSVPREQLKQRAQRNQTLLLLLMENEICRMATWANPTDQRIGYLPDVSRFARDKVLTDVGWQNLIVDAWVADPRLAVQLTQRFSNPAVRRELKSLICRFPGELVREPDALPLLIEQLRVGGADSLATNGAAGGPFASGIFNNLGRSLTFREQKFLLYWSPVPPITSTAYLASSYSRNPLSLQYSMRALECFPVDITFFYIPQLVQALRHDKSGYVERAIVSSAQISQLFAHQIIWNMNANMFKDEESQVPDSLKPVLDRIVETIVGGLSGEDRKYYEKEFDFFGKVTGISGKLKPFIKKSKPEKKRKIDEEMRKIKVEPGVYLPSNPDGTVVDIDYNSGRPLQSHAKAPFMATFIISRPQDAGDEVQELLKESDVTVTPPETSSAASSIEESIDDGRLPPIEESKLLSDQLELDESSPGDAHDTSATEHELDVESLSSKLARAKELVHRSNSAISDAPDLIGISSTLSERVMGRPSRESGRSHSMAVVHAKPSIAATDIAIVQKRSASLLVSNSFSGQGKTAEAEAAAAVVAHNKVSANGHDRQSAKSAKKGDKRATGEIITRLSAIFKVGDDCRQDVLALQLIAVFKNIFTSCGLDLYLFPYRVVATAPGCGVIDVIPNSISRDQMGREKVNSLSDYFAIKYHGVDSIQYQQARSNFVQSLAAYSVLSYLLQFKDRHNGNIMIDDQGHIVHIDFGFILDIAPGGITFESAPFKLTTEYIQVMGGSAEAQPYKLFCELCIKAYLACRPYAETIIQIVALMMDSGLPCFKGETTLTKLRGRFQLERTEREAAQFMADRIADSFENKRTVMYDSFQKATNGIPY